MVLICLNFILFYTTYLYKSFFWALITTSKKTHPNHLPLRYIVFQRQPSPKITKMKTWRDKFLLTMVCNKLVCCWCFCSRFRLLLSGNVTSWQIYRGSVVQLGKDRGWPRLGDVGRCWRTVVGGLCSSRVLRPK